MRAPSLVAGLIFAAIAAGSADAHAQAPSASEQMLAQSLFEEGRQLMDRGKYAEACPKLAESQRLDPGGGTLLNLAICHEKEGRLGSAYLEMKSALSQAVKDGRKDREKIANEHIALLASRVPRLAVHVVREDPGLEVTVDGTALRKPAWDLLTVVDPGPHVIDAAAPGKAPFRQTITLGEGEQRTVQIPPLDVGDGRALPPPSAGPSPAAAAAAPAGAAAPPPEMETNPLWVASVVTGVTGFVVGLPAGYVWGMMAIMKSTCTPLTDTIFCASDGVRNTWLAVAAVGLGVGVVGTVGIGVFPRKIQVAPTATSSGAGAVVIGQF